MASVKISPSRKILTSPTINGGTIGATTVGNAQFTSPVNAQTGTTYTLVATDCGKIITLSDTTGVTLTLPQQSTLTTAAGFWCRVRNLGVGAVTIVKEGSETLDGNTSISQYGDSVITRPTTTKWAVSGGTSTKTFMFSFAVEIVANLTYNVSLPAFSGTITQIATICRSGTATATTSIDAVAVTATANAVSTSRQNQAVTAANTFTNSSSITTAITSNSSCVDMLIVISGTFTSNEF